MMLTGRPGMTAKELATWQIVHEKFDPFGEYRADLRTGMAMAPLLNAFLKVHFVSPSLAKHTDWILEMKPKRKKLTEAQSLAEMKAAFKAVADSYKKV